MLDKRIWIFNRQAQSAQIVFMACEHVKTLMRGSRAAGRGLSSCHHHLVHVAQLISLSRMLENSSIPGSSSSSRHACLLLRPRESFPSSYSHTCRPLFAAGESPRIPKPPTVVECYLLHSILRDTTSTAIVITAKRACAE